MARSEDGRSIPAEALPLGVAGGLPVNRRVNSPDNDDPECVQPVAVQSSLGL
jgi:hypothetical protein